MSVEYLYVTFLPIYPYGTTTVLVMGLLSLESNSGPPNVKKNH